MIMRSISNKAVDIRIANFTNIELSLDNVLRFDSRDIQRIVSELRKYSDLPYGYLFSGTQKKIVNDVLAELKDLRSACFPYVLFLVDESEAHPAGLEFAKFETDIVRIDNTNSGNAERIITGYAQKRFVFDKCQLKFSGNMILPKEVDVLVIGAGVTGLYAANKLLENNISFCVVDKRDIIGGIWSRYANSTSQVNTSEGAYRMIEKKFRSNRDHSTTREILEDMVQLARNVSDNICLNAKVDWIEKVDNSYQIDITRGQEKLSLKSKGVILAVNDRVGTPRIVDWENKGNFQGKIISGISDEALDFDWSNKNVVIIGMGAFAVENTRTALEGGASHVTVACRRHGTVCPKIIDYLNFTTPYDENFKHDKKTNIRNMLLWKKLYDQSGATQPECWMGKIKHEGHTISVSDIWFIGHYLNKIETIAGDITGMYESGIVVDDQHHIDADVVVSCVGFNRNASNMKEIFDYKEMYNNNYVDKDLMYLADAYIDDDAFNSFFGSSVLEMAKFYMDVYMHFFNNSDFDAMIDSDGIEKIFLEDRKWSHYIAAAISLIHNYPQINELAKNQIAKRTKNFLEAHDLETFISENKREWIDTHSFLAGKTMKEEDCLPYIFEKLVNKKFL